MYINSMLFAVTDIYEKNNTLRSHITYINTRGMNILSTYYYCCQKTISFQ